MVGKNIVPIVEFESKKITSKSEVKISSLETYLAKLNYIQSKFSSLSSDTFLVNELGYKSFISIFQSMVGNKFYVSMNECEDIDFCCISNNNLREFSDYNEPKLWSEIDSPWA